MNTINVIENGGAGNSLHMYKYASYAKQHPLGGRSKRLVLNTTYYSPYQQVHGTAVGSPIFVVVADLVMKDADPLSP